MVFQRKSLSSSFKEGWRKSLTRIVYRHPSPLSLVLYGIRDLRIFVRDFPCIPSLYPFYAKKRRKTRRIPCITCLNTQLGCSQVVRHRNLDPTFKGSNPFSPAILTTHKTRENPFFFVSLYPLYVSFACMYPFLVSYSFPCPLYVSFACIPCTLVITLLYFRRDTKGYVVTTLL